MKTLYLYGAMREKYGASFTLDVKTSQEAVRALAFQLPEFEQDVLAGKWHILRGKLEDQHSQDSEGIQMGLGHDQEIHLLPVIEGANQVLMIVVGIVIFVAGLFSGGTAWAAYGPLMMGAGAGLALGGIVAMTMKAPTGTDATAGEGAEDKPSFLFNGPTNTSTQGGGVPRGYGRIRSGSIVISAALYSENISV